MPKSKSKWKLVVDFPITEYRCGVRAGEQVRLRQQLVVRDHRDRPKKIREPGEIWTVVRGAAEEPRVVWLREPDGTSHTWDDSDVFWSWFERLRVGFSDREQRTSNVYKGAPTALSLTIR